MALSLLPVFVASTLLAVFPAHLFSRPSPPPPIVVVVLVAAPFIRRGPRFETDDDVKSLSSAR